MILSLNVKWQSSIIIMTIHELFLGLRYFWFWFLVLTRWITWQLSKTKIFKPSQNLRTGQVPFCIIHGSNHPAWGWANIRILRRHESIRRHEINQLNQHVHNFPESNQTVTIMYSLDIVLWFSLNLIELLKTHHHHHQPLHVFVPVIHFCWFRYTH